MEVERLTERMGLEFQVAILDIGSVSHRSITRLVAMVGVQVDGAGTVA